MSKLRVRVMYFASFREMTGISEEGVQLSDGSTVEALVEALKVLHEPLRCVRRILAAVNGEFTGHGTSLVEGDVVALFPPVSGG